MSIRSISGLFPPTADSPFLVTPDVPSSLADAISSGVAAQCSKCRSYLLQAEHFCPICSPAEYFRIQDSTSFNFFRIPSIASTDDPRPVLLLLDVEIRQEPLLQFTSLLVEEAAHSPQFAKIRFYIGFVSQHIAFCQYSPGRLRFSFVPCIEDLRACERSMESHAEYLTVAVSYAKTFLKMTTEKINALKELFQFLGERNILSTLQDIVYIFSGDIGNANYEPPPRLHLIQIATEPSDRNTHFALKANATYSLQTQINKSTLAHFTSCLGMGQISSRLTIFTSARLSIKAIYGPIRATSSNGSQTTLELKFFSREIPPYLIVRHAKSDVDYVSIQMVLAGFDGSLLVFNRAWRRASTAAEWAASINPAWYAVPFIQLRAVEALKAMGLASPWTVPEVKVRALKDVAIAKKKSEAIEKLILPLFSGADVFSDSQRAYLLLTGLYGGRRYYDELYEALTRGILDGPYLMIPPYLIFGDETIVDISQYNCGMAPIKFTARRYARLRSMIQDFRNEISDLQ